MWIIIKKNLGRLGIAVAFIAMPLFAFAANVDFSTNVTSSANTVAKFIGAIVNLVNTIIPLFLGIAALVLIWNIIRYVLATGVKQKESARKLLLYDVIAMAASLGILGLALFADNFLGITTGSDTLIGPSQADGPLNNLVSGVLTIINAIIPLLLAIGIVIFIIGIIRSLSKADSPKARENGKNLIIYGILTMAVILGVWGLSFFLKNIFFSGSRTPLQPASGTQGDYYPVQYDSGGQPIDTGQPIDPFNSQTDNA